MKLFMMDFIKNISKTDVVIIIAFLGNVVFAYKVILFLIKNRKTVVKHIIGQSILRDVFISIFAFFFGLISPVFLLFKSFSGWSGWQFWLTQILCWYTIISFAVLCWIIISMLLILNKKE